MLVEGAGIQFTQGQSGSFNLGAAIAAAVPSGHVVTSITPSKTLPSGVSADLANVEVDYDGAGAVASVGTVNDPLDLVIRTSLNTPEQDWLGRSTASGVFYSHNFTYKDAAKTQLITNKADMLLSVAQHNSGADAWSAWEQTIKLSGNGACRFNMIGGDAGRGSSGVGLDFSGIGIKPGNAAFKTVVKHEFYVQFAVYMDSLYRDFFYGSSSSPTSFGGKVVIVEASDASFDAGEVVLTRAARAPGGFPLLYRIPSPANEVRQFMNRYDSVGDWILAPFFDNGSPTVTSLNTMQQRHGLNYNAKDSNDAPDPDVEASNVPRYQSNGWTVFEMYIKQPVSSGAQSVVKCWMAPYGQPPVLWSGAMAASLPVIGALDGSNNYPRQIYTGLQLTNYHNQDQGTPNWPTTGNDTFQVYTEVIASDNPIAFPGGYTIPYPGTTTPPNYPASGSYEWI